MTALDTLTSVLAGAPSLPGARCRGHHQLFDEAAPGEHPDTTAACHAQAIGLCSHCPALDRCADLVDSLKPSKRPPGVVAGQVTGASKRPGRPRKMLDKPREEAS